MLTYNFAIVSVFFGLLPVAFGFECHACNAIDDGSDIDDCSDDVETCPEGVDSCSMVVFRPSSGGSLRVRKFCTAVGTPSYEYLSTFPGSSLCQNIETASVMIPPPVSSTSDEERELVRAKRIRRGEPPAPPMSQSATLVCVCTTNRCNEGTYNDMIRRTILRSIETPSMKLVPVDVQVESDDLQFVD